VVVGVLRRDFPGCVLTLAGKHVDIIAGYRMSAGRGHELATSHKVVRETRQRPGKGFVDLVAADALYTTEKESTWAVERGGYHLVVNTTDKQLSGQNMRQLLPHITQLSISSDPWGKGGIPLPYLSSHSNSFTWRIPVSRPLLWISPAKSSIIGRSWLLS